MSDWPITVSSCCLPNTQYSEVTQFSTFNSINKSIDIMSFGEDIYSFGLNRTQYVSMSGTSMATPQVTGCVALLIDYLKPKIPNKVERAKYVRDYLRHMCTKRDLEEMMSCIKLPNQFTIIDSKISTYQLGSERTKILMQSNMIKLIENLLEADEIIEYNTQFSDFTPKVKDITSYITGYMRFKRKILEKYTILSLGFGILDLSVTKSFPDGIYSNIHRKTDFGSF
jgi:hypothetical protein